MTRSATHHRASSTRVRGLAAVIATAATVAAAPSGASAAFRAGDVGFSIQTKSGSTWVYGDSWNAGIFVRNAMTLNGAFKGVVRNPARSTWFWPGAPFKTATGRIAMYGAEVTNKGTGMFGFDVLGGVRAEFDPARPGSATLKRMAPGIIWAAASSEDSQGPIVYGVDANHHAHAGRPQADGSVKAISTMGGTISGQFSVTKEPSGKWWLVGQLPFLSRRVVAYPLSGPTGRVTGSALKLVTLPDPGPNRFTYAATLHPDYSGLMTYAVNGNGPGTPYGLQKVAGFWPYALYWARSAAAQAAAAKAKVARVATAADSENGKGNGQENGKGNGNGNKSAVAAINDSHVALWATEKQKDLEHQLAVRQHLTSDSDWISPTREPLDAGMNPNASAPATWDQEGSSDTSDPVGEDSDAQKQDFLVPATALGYQRQQAEAKAAVEAAEAALKDIAAQLKAAEEQAKADEEAAKAAEEQAKADEEAAKAAERLQEAQDRAAEAEGTEDESAAEAAKQAAEQAKQQAEAVKEAAKQAKEAAKQQAEQAKQQAEQAKQQAEAAKQAAKAKQQAASGNGRKSWD